MLKTIITSANNTITQPNYLLDDVIESFEKKGLNNVENDNLIKELTIQKIEYARMCIMVAFRDAKYALSNGLSVDDAEKNLDNTLLNTIVETKKM